MSQSFAIFWFRDTQLESVNTFAEVAKITKRGKTPPMHVLDVTLIRIWWRSSDPGALGNVEYLPLPLLQGQLGPAMVVPVSVPSMSQIELFNLLIGIIII